MNPKRREPKPGDWTYTVGDVPCMLTAHERTDRGLAIYTRIWDGKAYRDRRRLMDSIRDADGRIVPALELRAQQAAIDRQEAIAGGDEDGGALTLAAGFRKLLHARDGKYAKDSRWKGDTSRNATTIIEILEGRELLWSEVKHKHYRKLWRELATRHVRDGSFGPRQAEVIVGVLQSTARWLQEEELIEPGAAMPAPTWKQQMRAEWVEITEKPIAAPKKPRYTRDEQTRLWRALPDADPRIALAVEIGAELRLGQVPRTKRSDVVLDPDGWPHAVAVHGRGKKRGGVILLTDHQSTATARALTGYLADLEEAYQAGDIDDYYLITGGYLAQNRAQVKNAGRAWERTGMRKAWRALEELAEVEHVHGRNWYGLRRLHTDLAEDVEGDARVLNELGNWQHTHTREGYQEQGRTDIAERARDTRQKIRPQSEKGRELHQIVTPAGVSGESVTLGNG